MAIFTIGSHLFDGEPEVDHALISGMGVQPGSIRVTGVVSDKELPVAASIISNDEGSVFPGTPTDASPTGAAGSRTWEFTWDSVSEIGPDAVLRLEETIPAPPPLGATVNVILHFLGSFEENPFPPPLPQPITIQIGGPPGGA